MFKASVQTVTAAIVAGATVFGSTYAAVSADGVTSGEWISVVLNTVIAVVSALFHDATPKPQA